MEVKPDGLRSPFQSQDSMTLRTALFPKVKFLSALNFDPDRPYFTGQWSIGGLAWGSGVIKA